MNHHTVFWKTKPRFLCSYHSVTLFLFGVIVLSVQLRLVLLLQVLQYLCLLMF